MAHGNLKHTHHGVNHHTRQRWGWPMTGNSAKALKPPALRQLEAGTVVLAQVPYIDNDGWKTRPAVILSAGDRVVQLQPITSSWKSGDLRCMELLDWEAAGLLKPCALVSRSIELDRRYDLTCVIGKLSDRDWTRAQAWITRMSAASARSSVVCNFLQTFPIGVGGLF